MDEQEKEKGKYSVEELSALMTLCVAQNTKDVEMAKEQLAQSHKEKKWLIIGWVVTIIAFILMFLCYDVDVTNYGDFQNSKGNASTGQQADTMTINNNKE